ncbi:MAG: glycosyltransferase family 4 protein [Planctomycetota bacterium]
MQQPEASPRTANAQRKTILVISQTYVPDPAAVGQYMHEAAADLVKRGHRVKVYAADRGYEDTSQKFARRETLDGVEIRRLPFSSFGKGSIAIRLLGGMLFTIQAMLRGVWTGKLGAVLVSTSPPMAPMAALFIRLLRRCPVVFWAMDINPDQMIAMGKVGERSLPARLFDAMIKSTLKRSAKTVTLDRFMGQRLEAKVPLHDKLEVMPPWPLADHLEPVEHADNPFREEHGLAGKRVVMYSGNISPAHPVDTVLDAARRVQDLDSLVFLFIGGGLGKQRIDDYIAEHGLTNVRTLPYQPLDRLRFSLSAADVHLVAMGEDMIGIVHPCKVYGVLGVRRPVLALGPAESHVGEIVERYDAGWRIGHGDLDAAEALFREFAASPDEAFSDKGHNAESAMQQAFSKQRLCGRFSDVVEGVLR